TPTAASPTPTAASPTPAAASPTPTAPTSATPSRTAAAAPAARPATSDAARAAAADTRKPEAKKPEPKKPEAKKPPEPRPPAEKPIRRRPPERVARANPRAQPIDPYAASSPATLPIPAGPPGPPPPTAADKSRPDPEAAYKTGIQQYAHGDTAGALATFRASAAATPSFAPTWRGRGVAYEKPGNKGMARLAFKRSLQLAPGAGDAEQIRDRMERLGS